LLLLLLLAFALRLAGLNAQPLWWDEGDSIYFATQNLATLTETTARDIHPPLYYYLLHAWMGALGTSAESVRLLSVFIGTITVALIYPIARRLLGRGPALLTTLCLALSPFHIYYSQEVRMYGLATLLTLAATCALVEAVRAGEMARTPADAPGLTMPSLAVLIPFLAQLPPGRRRPANRRRLWLAYALLSALSLYTLYYTAFIFMAHLIYVVWVWRRYRPGLRRYLSALAMTGLLYLPWIAYAGNQLVSYVGRKVIAEAQSPMLPWDYLSQAIIGLTIGHATPPGTGPMLMGLLGAGLALGGIRALGRSRAGLPIPGLLLTLTVLLPVLGAYGFNLLFPFAPVGFQRFFLTALPFYWLLAATGFMASRPILTGKRRSRIAAYCLLITLLTGNLLALNDFYTHVRYPSPAQPSDDYRPVIAAIAAHSQPDDLYLAIYYWQIGYLYAYHPEPRPAIFRPPVATWPNDPAGMAADLDRLLARHQRVWVPAHQKGGRILEEQIEAYLAETAYPVLNDWFGVATRLYFYAAGEASLQATGPITLGQRLRLDGYALDTGPFQAGRDVLPVRLHWRLLAPLSNDYQVGLRLTDAAGRTWGQRDGAPLGDRFPFGQWTAGQEVTDRYGLLIPAGLPPGVYQLRLQVYDKTTGKTLSRLDDKGNPAGPDVSLGSVTIAVPTAPLSPAALSMATRQTATFRDGPRLLGYTLPAGAASPGTSLPLSLFWQAPAGTLNRDLVLFVQVQDKAGQLWGALETPGVHPTTRWQPGELVWQQVSVPLRADTPDGTYRLVVGWFEAQSKVRLSVGNDDQFRLQDLTVTGRTRRYQQPLPPRPLVAQIGDFARLLGYDLDLSQAKPGGTIHLTLFWEALATAPESYKVFVHLLDPQGHIRGQQDQIPLAGAAPTTSWLAGEYLVDTYTIPVAPDAPATGYLLVAGFYRPADNLRLPVRDAAGNPAGDTLLLDRFNLKP